MSLKTRIGGLYKTTANTNVIRLWLGAWKIVTKGRIWVTEGDPPTSGWRDFYIKNGSTPTPTPSPTPTPTPPPPVVLAVVINPTEVSGFLGGVSPLAPHIVQTDNATAVVSNGTGPYTFNWTLIAWNASTAPTIVNPNGNSTQFNQLMTTYSSKFGRFRCLVTDSLGNTGSATVDATFTMSKFE